MKEWTGLYNKVRSKITDKSSALLVNWSPKQIYKTLHQPITSPIRSKAAILATSHEITILLSTTVGGGGRKVYHQQMLETCFKPCLKKVSTNWYSSWKWLYQCLSASSVMISSILLFEQINYFCNYPILIQISNGSLRCWRKREQCRNNIYALWHSTEKTGESNSSSPNREKLQRRPNLIIIF